MGSYTKKRLDTLISIEDFLASQNENGNYEGKKLSARECDSLEGDITLDELTTALNKSNMNSACGWDRVLYWLIKKYWVYIGPVLTRCANESFNEGELSPTFRTGLIKIIPK